MADISIRKVSKSYGKTQVVHGLDCEITSGEFVVILGPSGCGKSTLLRMIAGLEAITGGEVAIDNTIVNTLEPRERGCAMVFQNYALYPHMSVAENIGYALKVAGVPKAERLQRIEAAAKTLGLTEYLDRKPGQLSGGQRQRVAMGRAMIREPKVFLFDEPLSNLDAKLRVQMRIEIRKLHNRLGATSIFVTHDQIEAMTLADRLLVMNAGRIEQIGTPEEIYKKPATRFVAGFVGSPPMNLLYGEVDQKGSVRIGEKRIPVATGAAKLGTKILLGIRPEDTRIGAGDKNASRLTLEVDFIEELGAQRLLHGQLDGQDFVMLASAEQNIGQGPLTFTIPQEKLHLFDFTNGHRIEVEKTRATAEMVQ